MRWLAVILAVVMAVAGCGGTPKSSATSPPDAGPTGDFEVAGRTMHLECRGRGEITVLLESGLGVDSHATWAAVAPPLSRLTRTCWYDRAGTGGSAPASGRRTSAAMVRDLRELLRVARVSPPYLLVGASLGGLNAQLFAATAPGEVVGLVLVDALHPDFDRRFAEVMGHRAAMERAAALERNPEGVRFRDLLASDREVRRAGPLPRVPIRVLVHGISFDPGGAPIPRLERAWRALAAELAAAGRDGEVVVAERSHHRIAEDEPDVVVDAVREVLAAAEHDASS
jgi:pimeloyl-ACP methyl ester carboxylesterase